MKLEVGKPYIPGRTSLPARAEYNFRNGQHELLLCFHDLDEQTVEEVRHGECEFALPVYWDLIFFLYRFGQAVPWSDAPYPGFFPSPGQCAYR